MAVYFLPEIGDFRFPLRLQNWLDSTDRLNIYIRADGTGIRKYKVRVDVHIMAQTHSIYPNCAQQYSAVMLCTHGSSAAPVLVYTAGCKYRSEHRRLRTVGQSVSRETALL